MIEIDRFFVICNRYCMRKSFILILIIFFSISFTAHAAGVVINEIGWMGTVVSASDEWVELYNASASAVDLTGWTLSFFKPATTSPSKIISLSGTIFSGGYYLIERTDDTTISDVAADIFTAFGTGLVDSGMILRLADNSSVVDSSPELCDNKWCAGLVSPETSMERISPLADGSIASNWATNNGQKINGKNAAGNSINGTPKSENSVYVSGSNNVPPSPPPPNQEGHTTSETNELSNLPSQSSSAMPETFKVYAGEDKTVLAGQETVFSGKVADLKGKQIDNARFLWNFGDGSTSGIRVTSHTFLFPGKYIVNLNASIAEESHADYLNVEVLTPKIIISEAKPGQDGFIELQNETGQKLDIGGLIIKDASGGVFSVPQSTILDKNALLVFPNAIMQIFYKTADLTLVTSNGRVVDSAHFEGVLDVEESFAREGSEFIKISAPSPGNLNTKIVQQSLADDSGRKELSVKTEVVIKTKEVKPESSELKDSSLLIGNITAKDTAKEEKMPDVSIVVSEQLPDSQTAAPIVLNSQSRFLINSKLLLGASILVGILGAVGFFILRSLGRL
ncbi:MAG: Phospholipase D/competence protein ComEA helix-hairpin-helix domain protein [Parcubacteria group bacterium GW2011_GWA2_42_14]|nr:MAG: Phospholipase D/competence protein ComEA helix-hairpin-helix domain protein [Parcubacteria group bacterium GW2011_GWA2_42_14]